MVNGVLVVVVGFFKGGGGRIGVVLRVAVVGFGVCGVVGVFLFYYSAGVVSTVFVFVFFVLRNGDGFG